MRDVLDRLFAEVLVAERELVPNLFVNGPRDADAAGVGETFQPRRDIDSVAVDLVAFDHHIAEVDADAEVHPPRRRQPGVLNLERALNIHRAIDRIDHAGELGKYAIAGRIYEAPVALLDEAIDDLAVSGQGDKGRLLISPHEAAVAEDVGTEDSGEFAFHSHLSAHNPAGPKDCQISPKTRGAGPMPSRWRRSPSQTHACALQRVSAFSLI